MGKFYAVKKGRQPGIYTTWPDCQKQVSGFSGAIYKSFASKAEAEAFMGSSSTSKAPAKTSDGQEIRWLGDTHAVAVDDKASMSVYVDGSFDKSSGYFGYGGVVLYQGEVSKYSGGRNDAEFAKQRNVAGEVIAAMQAVNIALKANAKQVVIFHDYMGIAEWALGSWQAKNKYTQEYRDFMQAKAKEIAIGFTKVAAHTGDTYNEMADQLAKNGIQEAKKANR
ncbi:reverse transcriptase-like protein [Aerococcus agrisoli]|uniref:Ribonuclease H n=1 Tax=Aerococcus agrisoli TaxID=2487350 RepID=A0A3N4HEY4_9LACT|nr:ribonuclease H family protein [Aerococcus agrisoli]RPA65024.1 reverse transcriptase-like protein [Aerococcus agrisoli]